MATCFRKKPKQRKQKKYNKLTKRVQKEINRFRNEKWSGFITSLRPAPTSTTKLWKQVALFRNQPNKTGYPTLQNDTSGTTYNTDTSKANYFELDLQNQFSDTNKPEFDELYKIQQSKIANEYFSKKDSDKLIEISVDKIVIAIKNINNKPTMDNGNINNILIKQMPPVFRKTLPVLFNRCLREDRLPRKWKHSLVSMIPKKPVALHLIKSYRPISTSSTLCKVYEKIIQSRMSHHLCANNLLTRYQSGFRSRRQTKDNIFFVVHKALEAMNRNKTNNTKPEQKLKTDGITFDIKRAFNKV